MYTYIIESQGYHKIGKAVDVLKRINGYKTHNPVFKIILILGFDCERYLHRKFLNKRFRGEWFTLNDIDIAWIESSKDVIEKIIIESKTVNLLSRQTYGEWLGQIDTLDDDVFMQEYKKHMVIEKELENELERKLEKVVFIQNALKNFKI